MGYKMPYQEDCRTCPYWGDWKSECDYFGYCATRDGVMQGQEEVEDE